MEVVLVSVKVVLALVQVVLLSIKIVLVSVDRVLVQVVLITSPTHICNFTFQAGPPGQGHMETLVPPAVAAPQRSLFLSSGRYSCRCSLRDSDVNISRCPFNSKTPLGPTPPWPPELLDRDTYPLGPYRR